MPKQDEVKQAAGHTWMWETDPAVLQGHPAGWYSEETPPQYGGKDKAPKLGLLSQRSTAITGEQAQSFPEQETTPTGLRDPQGDMETRPSGPRVVRDPQTGQWFQEIPPEFEGDPPSYRPFTPPQGAQQTGAQPQFWTDPSTGQRWQKSSATDEWKPVTPTPAAKTPSLEELIVQAIQKGDWDSAVQLDDFARRPSQSQRLDQAIRYAQSPADYLSVVGMMRGEIPIPSGGFPGEPSYRVGPRSQVFDAFGVPVPQQPTAAQTSTAQQPSTQPSILGKQAAQAQPSILGSNGQNALPPAGQPSFLQQVDRQTGQLIDPTLDPFTGEPLNTAMGATQNAPQQAAPGLSPPVEYDEFGNPSNYDFQGNYIGAEAPAGQFERALVNQTPQAAYPSLLQQQNQQATQPQIQPQQAGQLQQQPSGYPSFLEQAYGQNVIQGRAQNRPSLSYPALAAAAGVPLPRFRSAQTRLYQSPMEKQLFEAALMAQGVDVPTYLQQEQFGTTPGGSRRRRVETVSR